MKRESRQKVFYRKVSQKSCQVVSSSLSALVVKGYEPDKGCQIRVSTCQVVSAIQLFEAFTGIRFG